MQAIMTRSVHLRWYLEASRAVYFWAAADVGEVLSDARLNNASNSSPTDYMYTLSPSRRFRILRQAAVELFHGPISEVYEVVHYGCTMGTRA